ncbi:hypothetical protein [Bradyrhizobium archetypum]|uniref:Uncharacterized protein n=1 Tax=Bradyrhizobium archetypum TaxID=2721160 RepID=A0A7Y4M6D1_9BRAD|nr:hypothetical protein [Bradyrhizobium archetypum]NOJ50925.1 hypothetical protein [Bradyrhizobium archetypum]
MAGLWLTDDLPAIRAQDNRTPFAGYSKLGRCALNREAIVGPAHRILVHAVDFDGGNASAGTQHPDVLAFEGAASGRDESLLIEYCSDLAIHFVFSIQLDDPSPQPINVDVIAVGVNAPL